MVFDLDQITGPLHAGSLPDEGALLVTISGLPLVVPVCWIKEVAEVDNAIPVPFAPNGVVGAMAIRGSVVGMIDLVSENTWRPFILVLAEPAQAIGILVDSVEGISGFKPPEYTSDERSLASAIRETLGLDSAGQDSPSIPEEARILHVDLLLTTALGRPGTTETGKYYHN